MIPNFLTNEKPVPFKLGSRFMLVIKFGSKLTHVNWYLKIGFLNMHPDGYTGSS